MSESSVAHRSAKGQGHSPCCLTIAGSDSGGNAGVQADLRTFHAYGLHGCTVFTALTAQTSKGVEGLLPVPAAFVAAQLAAVISTYSIAALKTGMLGGREVVEAIVPILRRHPQIVKVVDPVMIATSGARLSTPETIAALKVHLLPLADILTPNLPEAEVLSGRRIRSDRDLFDVARSLRETCGCRILIKGGHRQSAVAKDVYFDGREFFVYEREWIENPVSTHGTGCTFAAALTARLALGDDFRSAIGEAKRHVHRAIATSYFVGDGCGVLGWGDRGGRPARQRTRIETKEQK